MKSTRKPSALRWLGLPLAVTMAVTACGSDDSGGGGGGEGGDGPTEIRFLIAPDPVWDYLNEEGIVKEYEEKYNMKINTNASWDEFQFFAGGHGDIVSLGTLELPILEQQTGVDTVTFGRYNSFRSSPAARCDSGWETLEDVPEGSKIGVNSPVSAGLLWDLYTRETYGYPLEVNNPDNPYEMLVEDHFVMPELLARGDLDVAVLLPEAASPYIRSGEICYMYDGEPSWRIIAESMLPDPEHQGIMSNLFTSTKEFYDENPEAIDAFLALWERGIKEWQGNRQAIVERYPQHFTVEEQEDIDFVVDYLESDKDFFAETVYMDEDWIESETAIYDSMIKNGLMEDTEDLPEFVVEEPIE
jgi:ABC-type nitrate/sulfonate/bicarbonate transport system substrate-binding protein